MCIDQQFEVRAASARSLLLRAIHRAGSGHPGGSLSCVDVLEVLYSTRKHLSDLSCSSTERDHFIMSKGHACPAWYAVAAGHGLCSEEDVLSLRALGSDFQGHPDAAILPWVEASTGSLGQGFSVAIGVAQGLQVVGSEAVSFVMLGDGELQEGQVWEGAMFAAHHGLGNLVAIVDYNKMQSDATNEEICGLEPLVDKWTSFGWQVAEVDGHDMAAISKAIDETLDDRRPSVLIAHTFKGAGVSYMQGSPAWHGSVKMSDEQLANALQDIASGWGRGVTNE